MSRAGFGNFFEEGKFFFAQNTFTYVFACSCKELGLKFLSKLKMLIRHACLVSHEDTHKQREKDHEVHHKINAVDDSRALDACCRTQSKPLPLTLAVQKTAECWRAFEKIVAIVVQPNMLDMHRCCVLH